ncbi:unnamed protein product [Adineta steineri]|uniref:NHL repeat containing protein n=1 Tax=Adineta steineri TaxID=433720 RepID=A0A815GPS8_9BILA|nr:unnamed protein product [Adineta steineri]CAF1340986.1 unnamed protein product [Adineta steineri]CAF1356713.1 unnamed protein product [Adineta steineri]
MNNRIGPDESVVVNPNTARLQTLCENFRKRKSVRIIISIGFIIVIIAMPIVYVNETKREKTSTMEITKTTTTTTELIATKTTTTTTITTNTTTTTATTTTTTTISEQLIPSVIINNNTQWKQYASTIAGGNGLGNKLNQLDLPRGIYVDNDDDSIYIADTDNHRVVRWEFGAKNGTVVAGGNGRGYAIDQLYHPVDVILDKEKKYIIICDQYNSRVIQWSRQNSQIPQVLIDGIACWGLAMDNNGDLYISDSGRHQVIRWQQGDKQGTIVAGGHGQGNRLNQLNHPVYIFVDGDHHIYVADGANNRVVKWMKNATEGTLSTPGKVSQENPSSIFQLIGVIVDHKGNIYVSNAGSRQIKRWLPGAIEGAPVLGENQFGSGPTQLIFPHDLSFDRKGNLYVVDAGNHRIQKFVIDLD